MRLRRKAPQIIVAGIVIVVVAYFLFEFLGGVIIDGTWSTSGPLVNAIISFTKDVTSTISSMGYIGVFALTLLDASSFPIPSEAILPFAGYLIYMGKLNFWLTIMIATIAGVAGSLIDYYIGLKGVQVLSEHRLLGKIILSPSQLEVAANRFNKYGSIMVLLGRLIPVFRTLVSFPAGAVKMSTPKFVALTTAGCLVWNTVLIYVGFYLGSNWTGVAGVSRYLILGFIAAILITIIIYLLIRRKRRHQVKQAVHS